MSYTDFSIDTVMTGLDLEIVSTEIFPALEPLQVQPWLRDLLDRGSHQVLLSEKARSEFIVAPILLAAQELTQGAVTIYSGQRLDVDPARGLVGECDFILSATLPLPGLRAPLVTIVEAKKHDIESGIWQCIAQMMGARLFNERAGSPIEAIYGCVTSGEVWQFLRLSHGVATIDHRRFYLDNVGLILAAFVGILGPHSLKSELTK
jgi:hypothetical protein